MLTIELATDKTHYQVGDTIVATVTVDGAEPGGEKQVTVTGTVTVDGQEYTVQAAPVTITWPGADVQVTSITADGITFTPTGDPMVWAGTAA